MTAPVGWVQAIDKVGLLCAADVNHPDPEMCEAMFDEPMVSLAMAIHEPDPLDAHKFTGEHRLVGLVMARDQAAELAHLLLTAIGCSTECFARYKAERN